MNIGKISKEYLAPEITEIDIHPESVLCASNQKGFTLDLEDMTENDYTFSW